MSWSTQSQESISAIDAELHEIMRKRKKQKQDTKEGESDSESISDSGSPIEQKYAISASAMLQKNQNKQKENSPRKRERSGNVKQDNPNNDDIDKPEANQNEKDSSTSTAKMRPAMQRTRSLEVIERSSPAKIVVVALEKTNTLLKSVAGNRDYKKIKYWLKIAHYSAGNIDKEEEFYSFVKGLQKNFSEDASLQSLIDSEFNPSNRISSQNSQESNSPSSSKIKAVSVQ